MYLRLGNEAAIERPFGLTADGGVPAVAERLEGQRVTRVEFPEGRTLIEAFTEITAPGGVWAQHAGTETIKTDGGEITRPISPTWVESDNSALAELVAANYPGCVVGAPENVESTHHTEAGPPGIGPDGPIAGTLAGDAALAAEGTR